MIKTQHVNNKSDQSQLGI